MNHAWSQAKSIQEGNYLDLHGRSLSGLTVIPELGREVKGGLTESLLASYFA